MCLAFYDYLLAYTQAMHHGSALRRGFGQGQGRVHMFMVHAYMQIASQGCSVRCTAIQVFSMLQKGLQKVDAYVG